MINDCIVSLDSVLLSFSFIWLQCIGSLFGKLIFIHSPLGIWLWFQMCNFQTPYCDFVREEFPVISSWGERTLLMISFVQVVTWYHRRQVFSRKSSKTILLWIAFDIKQPCGNWEICDKFMKQRCYPITLLNMCICFSFVIHHWEDDKPLPEAMLHVTKFHGTRWRHSAVISQLNSSSLGMDK